MRLSPCPARRHTTFADASSRAPDKHSPTARQAFSSKPRKFALVDARASRSSRAVRRPSSPYFADLAVDAAFSILKSTSSSLLEPQPSTQSAQQSSHSTNRFMRRRSVAWPRCRFFLPAGGFGQTCTITCFTYPNCAAAVLRTRFSDPVSGRSSFTSSPLFWSTILIGKPFPSSTSRPVFATSRVETTFLTKKPAFFHFDFLAPKAGMAAPCAQYCVCVLGALCQLAGGS
mmetsp:Transcript_23710/g.61922  ORF Transcript_23710/g.61922 Transcript_23710/m.61922 type:complete len:230 (+) Transcript_23710:383-1072(+)